MTLTIPFQIISQIQAQILPLSHITHRHICGRQIQYEPAAHQKAAP